jgi:hypothetical protein
MMMMLLNFGVFERPQLRTRTSSAFLCSSFALEALAVVVVEVVGELILVKSWTLWSSSRPAHSHCLWQCLHFLPHLLRHYYYYFGVHPYRDCYYSLHH